MPPDVTAHSMLIHYPLDAWEWHQPMLLLASISTLILPSPIQLHNDQ